MSHPIISADPKAGYLAAQADIDAAIKRVLESGRYILGPEVEAFEKEFARWLGVAGTVGVANGTDALELALRAAGVGPGDRVATVGNTVTATVAAIVAAGAEPVYIEIDPHTMLMDPAALEKRLAAKGKPIKAVMPVHLYGQGCDMPHIAVAAKNHGAVLIEDCAQAHGSLVAGRKVGTWGALSAFSFYPTKNLGALGDAGAVVGSDAAMLEKVRLLRQYGWRTRYVSDEQGRNSRLDEMQAAILRVRLKRLEIENAQRTLLAGHYLEKLAGAPVQLPFVATDSIHTWHQFVVRTPKRDALKTALERSDIHCGVLYPVPVYRQPAYDPVLMRLKGGDPAYASELRRDEPAHAKPVNLPETERACAEVLSLPLHLGMTPADVDRVAQAVRNFRE